MATKWLGQPQNMMAFGKYLSRVSHSGSRFPSGPSEVFPRSKPRPIAYAPSRLDGPTRSSSPHRALVPTATSGPSGSRFPVRSLPISTHNLPPDTESFPATASFIESYDRSPSRSVSFTNTLETKTPPAYRKPRGTSSFSTGKTRSLQITPSSHNIMWSAQRWGDIDCPSRASLADRRKALWSAYESGIVMALEAAKVSHATIDPHTQYGRSVLAGQSYLSSKLGSDKWERRVRLCY
jgi:hypothetical protein